MNMTIETIIGQMSKLKQLHESLFILSKKKTEALKANDTSAIQQLLTQERKHVQAIEKVEKERMTAVQHWYQAVGGEGEDPTISQMIEMIDGAEKNALLSIYEAFIIVLADLKKQEQLNAELTKQSLQFIHLSLDMLQPSIQKMNYGNKEKQGSGQAPKRSLFDSKA